MSVRRLAVVVVLAIVAVAVVATITIFVLWSSGEEPPTRQESHSVVRR